jgi:hypothetical protein
VADVVVEDEGGLLCAKISSADWEMNVRAPARDFAVLSRIRAANWDRRETIAMGLCAGSPVFWAYVDQSVSVLIGSDDESWDAAFTVPVEVVDQLVALAESAAP